jgi:hypothetical protein
MTTAVTMRRRFFAPKITRKLQIGGDLIGV